MKLNMREKSECFRGFLLLIAQDRVIRPEERELLRHIGKVLDFEKQFCEEAMDDLLDNVHIPTTPPEFSRREYAEAFLIDCIRIASTDHDVHPNELGWLNRIAQANGLPASWVDEAVKEIAAKGSGAEPDRMEIETYL